MATNTTHPESLLALVQLIVVVLIVLYLKSVAQWRARTRGLPLPPGPRRLPIVGNMFDLPRSRQWVGYRDLSRELGERDCTFLQSFELTMLIGRGCHVLSSPWAVHRGARQLRSHSRVSGQAFRQHLQPRPVSDDRTVSSSRRAHASSNHVCTGLGLAQTSVSCPMGSGGVVTDAPSGSTSTEMPLNSTSRCSDPALAFFSSRCSTIPHA